MKLLLFLAPLALVFAQNANVPPDNEFVHVVFATDKPAPQPGRQHEHKLNRVMIYLDSGDIQIKYANGKVEDQHWKAGDVVWSPANGLHTSQNVGSTPVRIVEIEVKSEGNSKATLPVSAPVILDNGQVRVYRGNEAPKAGNYVATDLKNATALWNKMPEGPGPFVVTEIK